MNWWFLIKRKNQLPDEFAAFNQKKNSPNELVALSQNKNLLLKTKNPPPSSARQGFCK